MLLVKAKLKPSKIHGIGVFADQFIPKGTLLWKENPLIDCRITQQQFKSLPLIAQEKVLNYCFLENGEYVICGDDARFFNHSDNPNVDDISQSPNSVAARDIQKGEEIVSNYKTYDEDWERKLKASLKP